MEQIPASILEAALMLPEQDRMALASRLLESVPSDDAALAADDPSLIAELDRRFADRDGGIAWPDLRAEGMMPSAEVLFHRLAANEYRWLRSGMRAPHHKWRRDSEKTSIVP